MTPHRTSATDTVDDLVRSLHRTLEETADSTDVASRDRRATELAALAACCSTHVTATLLEPARACGPVGAELAEMHCALQAEIDDGIGRLRGARERSTVERTATELALCLTQASCQIAWIHDLLQRAAPTRLGLDEGGTAGGDVPGSTGSPGRHRFVSGACRPEVGGHAGPISATVLSEVASTQGSRGSSVSGRDARRSSAGRARPTHDP